MHKIKQYLTLPWSERSFSSYEFSSSDPSKELLYSVKTFNVFTLGVQLAHSTKSAYPYCSPSKMFTGLQTVMVNCLLYNAMGFVRDPSLSLAMIEDHKFTSPFTNTWDNCCGWLREMHVRIAWWPHPSNNPVHYSTPVVHSTTPFHRSSPPNSYTHYL